MRIRIHDVSKCFGTVRAVDSVNLQIEAGEMFFLLGASGCGKTTLLRILAGLETPDRGRILFDDEDVTHCPPHRRSTAMVFQGYALWPHMTVHQNVAFALENRGLGRDAVATRVREVLEMARIADLAERKPNALSGGQQQRVALARTLAAAPSFLLLDEPLANLDAALRQTMRREIRRLCRQAGVGAVYVTHDQNEALSMADRMAVMADGRLVQTGTPVEVYRRPANPFVAQFVGETNLLQGRIEPGVSISRVLRTVFADLPIEAPGVEHGETTTASARPECLRLNGVDEPATDGSFEAVVSESVYLGGISQYTLDAAGVALRAVEINRTRPREPGDRVRVSIDPGDLVLFPGR